MLRYDLMNANRVVQEYKPLGWTRRSRRAYSRKVDRALRYLTPPDITFEDLFWFLMAAAAAGVVLAFPVAFVCWWLGII